MFVIKKIYISKCQISMRRNINEYLLFTLGLKYSFEGPVMKDFCFCFEFAGGN